MSSLTDKDGASTEQPGVGEHRLDSANRVPSTVHKRRPRYAGKYPRRFEDKYKELRPDLHPDTMEKVLRSGKTPAGSHRPIMVAEVLAALAPSPGKIGVDCTLGFGGHAEVFLERVKPGGRLIGLDADPVQLPKTEARLSALGYGPAEFTAHRTNFAGLPAVLLKQEVNEADFIFADLGVSSMQLDNPARGFSFKVEGPLDMRMNPERPITAAALVRRFTPEQLEAVLRENADEPHAVRLAVALAGCDFQTTRSLSCAIDAALTRIPPDDREAAKRRVFQALRIAVNEEFSALEALLRVLPGCLAAGGRAVFLTFHSGEDRRVKQSFLNGLRSGIYSEISHEVTKPSAEEVWANPRARPAKLRWAIRSPGQSGGSL